MKRILTLTLTLALAASLLTGCTRRRNDNNTVNTDNSIVDTTPAATNRPNTENSAGSAPMDTEFTEDNHNGSVSTDPDGDIGNTESSDHSESTTETGEITRGRTIRHR